MGIKLGMEAKPYRNTGTYAAPTWVELSNVKDVTLTAKPTYSANPPSWMTVAARGSTLRVQMAAGEPTTRRPEVTSP